MKRLALLLGLAACNRGSEPLERVAPPSVAMHPPAPLMPPPPPPPPPPKGLGPDEPGEVPAPIARFIAAHPAASAIANGHDLGQARAALIMLVLRDPITWGDSEPGCCTEGRTSVRFSDGDASLELAIDGCCDVDIVGYKSFAVLKPRARERLVHLMALD